MVPLPLMLGLACWLPLGTQNDGPAPPVDPEQAAAGAIRKALGVEFAVLESLIRRSIIRTKTPYGLKLNKVDRDSPAARVGWKAGDILLEWDGQPVKTLVQLDSALKQAKSGATARFKLARLKKDEPIWSRQPWQSVEGQLVPK